MQYYVTFAENGDITGFYVDEIHGDAVPDGAVPITVEQWQTYCVDARLYKLDESGDEPARLKTQDELDDEAAAQEPPPKTPDQIRVEQLEAQLALQNTNNIEFMEMVLQSLGVS